jgi:hypothetical protein
VTIAVGQYTLATFITALEAAASAIVLVVTSSTITTRLTLATTTAVEWLDISSNPMAEVLGIEYNAGSGADVTSFVPTGFFNLTGHSNVYVRSQSLGESNMLETNGSVLPMLAVLPLTVDYGAVEHYLTQHSDIEDVDSLAQDVRPIGDIDIRLQDYNGNTLDLHGTHVEIILKVYY